MHFLSLSSQIKFLFIEEIREKDIKDFLNFLLLCSCFSSFSLILHHKRDLLGSLSLFFFPVKIVNKELASSCKALDTPSNICSCIWPAFTNVLITLADLTFLACGCVVFRRVSHHSDGFKVSHELAFVSSIVPLPDWEWCTVFLVSQSFPCHKHKSFWNVHLHLTTLLNSQGTNSKRVSVLNGIMVIEKEFKIS